MPPSGLHGGSASLSRSRYVSRAPTVPRSTSPMNKALADVLPLLGAARAPAPVVRVAHPPSRVLPADEPLLCAAALRGEREAWSTLVQRHNQRVVVALLARGVRIDKAKD